MNPATVDTALQVSLLIGQALIKYGPQVAQALANILHKDQPTLEDWNTLFKIPMKSYDDYVKPQ